MFLYEDPERKYLLFAEGDEGAEGGSGGEEGAEGAGDEGGAKPNGETDDWRSAIEDESLRRVAERFTSPVDAVKAVADLRKRESNSVRLPGKNASEEDIASYRKAIGVPESPDKYKFSMPEGHEPTEADAAFQKSVAETFHTLGVPAETAQGLVDWFNEYSTAVHQAQVDADKQFAEESEAQLKKEWPGAEFDRNKTFANQAALRLFGDELEDVRNIETKDGRFVLDHPAFVRILAQYGREMEEGTLGGAMSEAQIETLDGEIDDLQSKIEEAQRKGDPEKANSLYIKQQELYRKKVGSASPVGAQGRTV